MKKIENLFFDFRCKSKNDCRNKDWAKKDAHAFVVLFNEVFPNRTIEEACQYLTGIKDNLNKDAGIQNLLASIHAHLNPLRIDTYTLSRPYQRCKKILRAWLSHWENEHIDKFIQFLYNRFSSRVIKDDTAILDIIQYIFIKTHLYREEQLTENLLYKVARNSDLYKMFPDEEFMEIPDEEEDLLAEGFYHILSEPNIYSVDDFYKLVVRKYDLSKNDRIILDIAYELCKEDIDGKNPKEKLKNFKKRFKAKLKEEELTGNTLNQAIKRLRDKISEAPGKAPDDEAPKGLLMGFIVEEVEPTPEQKNKLTALEFLLERLERRTGVA